MPLLELTDVRIVREGRTILDVPRLAIEGSTAILGPNGSGKSTLLRVLAREIHPYAGAGEVRLFGRARWSQAELRRRVAVVSDEAARAPLAEFTALEWAWSGLLGTHGIVEPGSPGREAALAALERAGVGSLADRFFSTLSAGERRRTLVARALVGGPDLLVLDEPTTAMDPGARARFLRDLPGWAVPVLLVTHHVEEVLPIFERVLHLDAGRIVFDGGREGLDEHRLSALFGMP